MKDKPTPNFLYLSPVLASINVVRDLAWYIQKLGFKNVYDSSAYSEGSIDYAVIGRENFFLHLQFQYPKDMVASDIKFEVKNIQLIFEECVAKGLIKTDQLQVKTPWNTSEFGIKDPSGNRIIFLESL